MTIAQSELAAALADVRKAYRLLHAYHRRLCDILATVDEALGKGGLNFQSWAPTDGELLKHTKRFFLPHLQAWHLTPAYRMWSGWQSNARNGKVRIVHIEGIADTGYDESSDTKPEPRYREDAEKSTTQLWIGLWSARTADPDLTAAWKELDREPNVHDGQAHSVKIGDVEYTYQYLEVDIAELVDEAAVKAKMIAPIEKWMNDTKA